MWQSEGENWTEQTLAGAAMRATLDGSLTLHSRTLPSSEPLRGEKPGAGGAGRLRWGTTHTTREHAPSGTSHPPRPRFLAGTCPATSHKSSVSHSESASGAAPHSVPFEHALHAVGP